jgi:hypothetical protein
MEEKKQVLPKVLICAPQNEVKEYAWEKWKERVDNLTYPKELIEVFIADNSITNRFCDKMAKEGVTVEHTVQNEKGMLFTINDSHNQCRKYAIDNGFDFMLHLETDIIPPYDVIERLLNNKRTICAGTYDIMFGSKRKAMIQIDEPIDRNIIHYRTPDFLMEEESLFFDGKCKQVYHAGLGCVLIHKSVFELIEFKVFEDADMHSDTWFANHCYQLQIPIYADTSVQCEHYNTSWLGRVK